MKYTCKASLYVELIDSYTEGVIYINFSGGFDLDGLKVSLVAGHSDGYTGLVLQNGEICEPASLPSIRSNSYAGLEYHDEKLFTCGGGDLTSSVYSN